MRNAKMLTGSTLREDAGRERMAAISWPRVRRDVTNAIPGAGGGETPRARCRPREPAEMPSWDTQDVSRVRAYSPKMHKILPSDLTHYAQNDGRGLGRPARDARDTARRMPAWGTTQKTSPYPRSYS